MAKAELDDMNRRTSPNVPLARLIKRLIVLACKGSQPLQFVNEVFGDNEGTLSHAVALLDAL